MASPLQQVHPHSAHIVSSLPADRDEVKKKRLFYKIPPSKPPASSISCIFKKLGHSPGIFSTKKMKTAIIFVFLIGLVLLQVDARQLMLEEVKRARGQTEVKPSLVPAESGVNGDGVTAVQVYSNSEEKGNSEEKDDRGEASYGQGSSSASATHRVYPDLPSGPGH